MPYIVHTFTENRWPPDHRGTAVATLDEARAAAKVVIDNLPPDHSDRDWSEHYAAAMLLNSGGTIGPLPDRTMIEVAPTDRRELAAALGLTDREQSFIDLPTLIAWYNVR